MPPKRKNTKSNQIQPENPVDEVIQNVVQDLVNENTSTTPVSQEIQEIQTQKKGAKKSRTTKKKDNSSQQGSNVDLSIKAETRSQEEVTHIKKKPGRKPKVKQEIVTVREEPQEQQQYMTTAAAPQNQLLFINATPAEPVKKKPGRKPKAKKQEETQQHQQHPLPEEKIVNVQPIPAAVSTSSPAAIRNLINFDEDSFPPYGFNKNEINNSPPVAPSPVIQPVVAPVTTPISAAAPAPAPAPSKRGRPKKVKVDSQTVDATSTPDVTESHDAKPAPTRKRKPRKQEVSAESDKQSEIVTGESQEQLAIQQQQMEEVEQPTKVAVKKRKTKKHDAANASSALDEQTSVQPPVKTKRGRPKKRKPNDVDKSVVSEEAASTKMEEVNDTESKSVIESHIVKTQLPQQKLSANEGSQVLSEQQEPIDSVKLSSVGPKNSSVVLNEDIEIEHQECEKRSVSLKSQTADRDENVKLADVTTKDAQNKEEAVNSLVGEQSVKRKRYLDSSNSDDDDDNQPTPKKILREGLKAKMEMFSKLRSRMDEGESANRKEVYEEHQRKKTNPKEIIRQERKRNEAEKLLAKQQAEERGEDYERSRFWEYSIESVEKWEKKQEKKAKKSDVAFTDYNQVAHKKYKRQINELKPDLAAYNEQKAAAIASSSLITTEDGQTVSVDTESNFYRDANSLQYASVDNQPSREAIDRVVADVNKTIAKREKSSRQKTVNEEDDITYINERNRRFNEKIGRYYDKYTKEIKENFERGTAL